MDETIMKNLLAFGSSLLAQLFLSQTVWAYLLPVSGYTNDGSLYIDTNTIVRTPPTVTLTYVESFDQVKRYGSISYLSKATNIRLDCNAKRLFALSESYYSEPNLQGNILGNFPLNDQFGSSPSGDNWPANLLKLGCLPRRY